MTSKAVANGVALALLLVLGIVLVGWIIYGELTTGKGAVEYGKAE
jgi:hypothetical protein